VTRTRRRSASRPAGPPASADGAEAVGAEAVGDGDVQGAEQAADDAPALHVPVKRKASRKR
jgi:ribonuclease E